MPISPFCLKNLYFWQKYSHCLGKQIFFVIVGDFFNKMWCLKQVTELSTQLQKLEKGEFGLPEALAEARELKRSLAVRDADIVRLIKTTNQLQTSLDELSDQNLALR